MNSNRRYPASLVFVGLVWFAKCNRSLATCRCWLCRDVENLCSTGTTWLDNEDNAEKWYGNESGFCAKDRRILITLWAGSAYQKLISKDYDDFRWRLFEKTGCLITADGSEDDKISPEGLPEYKPPPPLDYIEPSTAAPVSNTVAPPTVDPEVYEVADNEEENEADNESLHSEELIDDAKDRCYNDELVGRSYC